MPTPCRQSRWPAIATLPLGCLTPILACVALRRIGGFDSSNSAGIAAHYGSVSAVTFIPATCSWSAMPAT